jgi:methyl-accepting chemotaxis protein
MNRLITRFPLAAWLIVGASLVVAIGLGVVVWRADTLMRAFAMERFQQQLRDDSLLLRERIKDFGPVHVEDGKLFAGKAGAAEFQHLVDQTLKTIDRDGAVYLGNVRVASSAVKADGTHPVGEAVDNRQIIDPVLKQGRETFFFRTLSGTINVVSYQPLQDSSGAVIGMVTSGGPMAFVDTMAQQLRSELFMSAAAVVLLGLGLLWVIIRASLRPLGRQAAVLRALAEGRTDQTVPGLQRTDMLGDIARAVVVVQQAVARNRSLEAEATAARSQADAAKRASLVAMADRIEKETIAALETVVARTGAMMVTADEMSGSATRTGNSAQSATDASAQALLNAQTVASATEQLTASIHEISGQVAQSTAVVGRAVAAGSETRATIEALNEQVARIGTVTDMIGEIAARTNLLALNATIEAARAGDAGKGFAVVASEVKALATQTTRSTQEISQHIGQVRSATSASIAAVARIERTIGEINAIASTIAAAVEQQGAATAGIARNVTETAAAADEMTNRTMEVSSEAEQTGKRAAGVRENVAALNSAVGELRQTLIRVVRTSTAEVDRRSSDRQKVDLPCHLSVPGQPAYSAQVAEISQGGAQVLGAPLLEPGSRGTLQLAGLALPFVVRSSVTDVMQVAFELDAATAARFAPALQRLTMSRAA